MTQKKAIRYRDRTCLRCGKVFTPANNKQEYCGSRTNKKGCSFYRRNHSNMTHLKELRKEWLISERQRIAGILKDTIKRIEEGKIITSRIY